MWYLAEALERIESWGAKQTTAEVRTMWVAGHILPRKILKTRAPKIPFVAIFNLGT